MKIIYVFILALFSSALIGQADLLEKKGSNYSYKGRTYKVDQLDAVYKSHKESLSLYMSGRSYNKSASTTAFIGLGFIGAGAIGIGVGLSKGDDAGLITAIVGVLAVGAGIVLEIIAITPKIIGNGKLRKARETFNYEMMKRHGYQADPSLSFGAAGNGMGLVLTF